MRLILRWAAVLAAALAMIAPAAAHSLDEVDSMLERQETYFQPLDRPAPEFTLRTADGQVVRLADFRGKVVVLHFIYTHCPDVCPLHAEKIAEVQAMVNETPMKERVEFITITTDPANDTPEVLRTYGPAHGLDPVNWLFLTTMPDQPEYATRKLAEAFGHTFSKTPDGRQMHGVVTHVIDKEGRLRANFHGLKFQAVNLLTFVNALTNDFHRQSRKAEPQGWWARVQEYFE